MVAAFSTTTANDFKDFLFQRHYKAIQSVLAAVYASPLSSVSLLRTAFYSLLLSANVPLLFKKNLVIFVFMGKEVHLFRPRYILPRYRN